MSHATITATLVTSAVALAMAAIAAWMLFRSIPASTGTDVATTLARIGETRVALPFRRPARHRLGEVANPYRPRSVLAAEVAALVTAQASELTAATEVVEVTDEELDAARRENYARGQVAAAGHSWDTHTMKFTGAVVPRPEADEDTRLLEPLP